MQVGAAGGCYLEVGLREQQGERALGFRGGSGWTWVGTRL